jgi:hypothetical protein
MGKSLTMEQHILKILLIAEGATKKVSKSIKPLKLVHNKNFCFNEQKCISEHCSKAKNNQNILTKIT